MNSSIRFTIYEAPPADLTSADTTLLMENFKTVHQEVLTGGNEHDLDTRRRRLTWGSSSMRTGLSRGTAVGPYGSYTSAYSALPASRLRRTTAR